MVAQRQVNCFCCILGVISLLPSGLVFLCDRWPQPPHTQQCCTKLIDCLFWPINSILPFLFFVFFRRHLMATVIMSGPEKEVWWRIMKIAKVHIRRTLGWLDGSVRPRALLQERFDFHMSHIYAGVPTEIMFSFSLTLTKYLSWLNLMT